MTNVEERIKGLGERIDYYSTRETRDIYGKRVSDAQICRNIKGNLIGWIPLMVRRGFMDRADAERIVTAFNQEMLSRGWGERGFKPVKIKSLMRRGKRG